MMSPQHGLQLNNNNVISVRILQQKGLFLL
jgi:hypothetical protein